MQKREIKGYTVFEGGPEDVLEYIVSTADDKVIILGPPGIGKTAIAFEAATIASKLLGRKLILIDDLRAKFERVRALEKELNILKEKEKTLEDRIKEKLKELKELHGELPPELKEIYEEVTKEDILEEIRSMREELRSLREKIKKVSKELDEEYEYLSDIFKHPEKYFLVGYFRLGSANPEDITGMPRVETIGKDRAQVKYMLTVPFPEFAVFRKFIEMGTADKVAGILIIDEVTGGIETNPLKADAVAALFGERKIGADIVIPPGIKLVGLGNRPGETYTAEPPPEHLRGRGPIIILRPPTFSEWVKGLYLMSETSKENKIMRYTGIDPTVIAFLREKPTMLYNPRATSDEDIKAMGTPVTPTPRGWTRFGMVLKRYTEEIARLNNKELKSITEVVLALRRGEAIKTVTRTFTDARDFLENITRVCRGYVGSQAAADFEAFLAVEVPDVTELYESGKLVEFLRESEVNARLLVLSAIASHISATFGTDEVKGMIMSLLSGEESKATEKIKAKIRRVLGMVVDAYKASPQNLTIIESLVPEKTALSNLVFIMENHALFGISEEELGEATRKLKDDISGLLASAMNAPIM